MKLVAFLAVVLLASPAFADSVGIGRAAVAYDPAVWRVIELSGVAALRFDCVAAECTPGAAVYVTATDAIPGDTLPIGSSRQPLDYALPAGAIPFKAVTAWSGCRALDDPILAARGAAEGVAYVFVTALGDGCNHQPSPPVARFLALLAGVKPG